MTITKQEIGDASTFAMDVIADARAAGITTTQHNALMIVHNGIVDLSDHEHADDRAEAVRTLVSLAYVGWSAHDEGATCIAFEKLCEYLGRMAVAASYREAYGS